MSTEQPTPGPGSTVAERFKEAVAHHRAGDLAAAVAGYRALLAENPQFTEVYCNLGDALRAAGRLDEAAAVLEEALQQQPALVQGLLNLAGVRRQQGRLEEAASCLEAALRRKPYLAEAHCNLGIIRDALGDEAAARRSFETAVDLNPYLAEAHFNLGNHFRRSGLTHEAETSYRRVIELRPESVAALNNLGTLLRETGRLREAEACFASAVQAAPDSAESHYNLGLVLEAEGRTDDAAGAFDTAFVGRPQAGLRIKRATLLPPIPESETAIVAARARFAEGIAAVRREGWKLADPLKECDWTNFYLAYHGENDRALQQAASAMFSEACPALVQDLRRTVPNPDGRLRLGFVSTYFKDHTIGDLFRGTIAAVDRERFTVTVFQVGEADDAVNAAIRDSADRYIPLPRDLSAARSAIAEAGMDALLFTDIGMDPATYFIAHARMAPVQIATWGHPFTTGVANVDYFLSARDFDPDSGAEAAYSERLAKLDDLLLCHARPAVTWRAADRERLGLDPDRTAYVSAQSLFKYHPAYDAIYADILRRDPEGVLYLLSGHREHWNRLLLSRMERTAPDIEGRIRFLPHVDREDFVRLLGVADVVLDTPVFSGGKTSLECLSTGTPVVTLPSPYLRGRLTYGFYRRMGVADCIAEDAAAYVEIAVGLGTDRDRRLAVSERIAATKGVLFDQTRSVRQFEAFLVRAASEVSG